MLYLVKHVHTPERCPAVNDEVAGTFGKMMQEEHREAVGVTVVGCWADVPGHTVYFIIDAESPFKVQKFLVPALGVGTAERTPVIDIQEAMQLV